MAKQTQIMIRGTLILSLAGLLAKIISVFYKVPLEYLTGTVGLNYYQTVYPLYSILTAAGLIGIPNSVAKLVAEEIAKKEYKMAHQTFRYAFILAGAIGLVVSLILMALGHRIIAYVHWDQGTYYALMGLSISPFFISVAGAIRGYLQGMQIMYPTAISQIIENIFKVIIGIGLVMLLLGQNQTIPLAVGGAALGASAGFILSSIYLVIVYLKKRKEIQARIMQHTDNKKYEFTVIARRIIMMAIPVTIASATFSIMGLVDSLTIPRILSDIIVAEGINIREGAFLMGVLGKVQTIINVPMVISVSLIISIVPSISAANVIRNKEELRHKINESIEIALKLALPAATGIMVLAGPILTFIYRKPEGSGYLVLFAICLIFMILSQSLIGILQGLTKHYYPVTIIFGSALVKIVLNIVLLNSPLKGYGAIISTLIYYIIISIASFILIRRDVEFHLSLYHTFAKPVIASAIMGIITYGGFQGIHFLLHSNAVSTLGSVIIGGLTYVVIMTLLRAFTRDEIMILPQHDKVILWLEKRRLLRD